MADEKMIDLLKDIKKKLGIIIQEENFGEHTTKIRKLWNDNVSGKFGLALEKVKSGEYDVELQAVGLDGELLTLKYDIWKFLWSGETELNMREVGIKEGAYQEDNDKKEVFELYRPLREKILEFINSLLGSLNCIPGFHLVKEFKEMMHISMVK